MSRMFDWWIQVPARTRALIHLYFTGIAWLLSICAIVLTILSMRGCR